jgi:predicted secreted hydrolase
MKRRALLQAALPLGVLAALPLQARATVDFPADFGAHPAQAIEWWYLTGLLGDAGEAGGPPRFGYQLTVFRLPGPAPANHPSALAARQLLLGHVALSDLQAGRQRAAQRLMRTLPGAVEARVGDCAVKLRDWRLTRNAAGYEAAFTGPGLAMTLALAAPEPPLLQGDAGISRKGPTPEQFSHYYSRPQLVTTAELTLDGRRQRLTGRSWLDHEWSDQILGDAVGWDWLGLNLHDGGALTLFQLRRADGSRHWAGGSLRRPGQPDRSFTPDEVRLTPTRHWRSPATGARYPVEWQLQSPAGAMRVAAWFEAQEIVARPITYWEGASRLLDASGHEIGAGYLEMTGYGGRLPLI